MAKEKTAVTPPEGPQNGAEPMEVSQDLLAEETAPERTVELVRCRVSWPGGVYLREGPGGAYCGKTVLPAGTEVLGADVADLLRKERAPDASMWLKVLSPAGSGWVDGAYLERLDESAE